MESAREECRDKIFSPLFLHLRLVRQQTSLRVSAFFFFGRGMRKNVQQESTKGDTFYAALWETTTKKERKEKKSAFILLHFFMTNIIALYQKMFRLTPWRTSLYAIATWISLSFSFVLPPFFFFPFPNCVWPKKFVRVFNKKWAEMEEVRMSGCGFLKRWS